MSETINLSGVPETDAADRLLRRAGLPRQAGRGTAGRSVSKTQGVTRLALVVASSIGADLAMDFLTTTHLPVEHVFFDGGQFAQIGKGTRRIMVPFLYLAIKEPVLVQGRHAEKGHVVR